MVLYVSTRREGKQRTLKTKQKHVNRKRKFQDNETQKTINKELRRLDKVLT